jgi:hypothetical protein
MNTNDIAEAAVKSTTTTRTVAHFIMAVDF